jgi:HEAT repeat protein
MHSKHCGRSFPDRPLLQASEGVRISRIRYRWGGDLGSTDWRDLEWIDENVRQAGRNAVPTLLAALQFPEPERRGHAAYLLGLTGDRTVVRSLAPLLADRTEVPMGLEWMPTVRAAAARALKKIGTTEALQALADAFE